jgi:hypothetical protein
MSGLRTRVGGAAMTAGPGWTRRSHTLALLALFALVGGMHGRSVTHGLFLDDHAHIRQLEECGWSPRELTNACRLELVGGVIDIWWLPETTLRFFRPVSFALMKLTYTLSGWSPMAMHIASLLWHYAVCVMLLRLLTLCGARPILALGVTTMFAIHPGHVATVQWVAAQTELMVTAFLLGAALLHGRRRGWWGLERGGGWSAVGAWVLFALACGCRENAVMLPFVLLVGEWQRKSGWLDALRSLAPYGAILALYLVLRTWMLGDATLPPAPYVIHPSDPEFVRFVFDKLCYYLISEFLLVPCIPFGGVLYFREHPQAFYGMTLGVAAVLGLIGWAHRDRRGVVFGLAWLVFFMLPVLPAFESPHHLYLPGIGWALLGMYGFQAATGMKPARGSWTQFLRHTAAWTVGVGIGLVFGLVAYFAGMAVDAAQMVEDRVVEEIAASSPPVRDGDTLYLVNLPTVAHYVRLDVERRCGVKDLKVHVLTWSPRLLGNQTGAEQVVDDPRDPRVLEVRVAEDRYFAGPLGTVVSKAIGRRFPVEAGKPVERPDFRVELVSADEQGISALRFIFREPLNRPGVHVYWGSRTRWAFQLPLN